MALLRKTGTSGTSALWLRGSSGLQNRSFFGPGPASEARATCLHWSSPSIHAMQLMCDGCDGVVSSACGQALREEGDGWLPLLHHSTLNLYSRCVQPEFASFGHRCLRFFLFSSSSIFVTRFVLAGPDEPFYLLDCILFESCTLPHVSNCFVSYTTILD